MKFYIRAVDIKNLIQSIKSKPSSLCIECGVSNSETDLSCEGHVMWPPDYSLFHLPNPFRILDLYERLY